MKTKILTFIVLAAVVLAGCGAEQVAEEATPTPYPTPVRTTYTVQRGDMLVEATLSGQIVPLASSSVSFEMPGKVSNVFVKVGDTVEAGQLLAELEELRDLEAQATEVRAKLRRYEIALEIAQLALDKARAEGKPEYDIKTLELQVELAQLDLTDARLELGLSVSRDSLDELDVMVSKARVYAPVAGQVISAVNVGRAVNPSTPAFLLGDPGELEVVAKLDPLTGSEDVKEMFEGMPVTVTLDAKPDTILTGTIRQLPSPYGTGSEDDTVRILLDKSANEDGYSVGDKVSISVTLANKTGILWLPPIAVRQTGGRTFVLTESPSGPKRVDVSIGLSDAGMIEIIAGLDEGQVVIGP